jgi:hypothetical protein
MSSEPRLTFSTTRLRRCDSWLRVRADGVGLGAP